MVIDLNTTADSPAGKCFSTTAVTLPPATATMPVIGSQVMPTSLGTAASATTYLAQKTSVSMAPRKWATGAEESCTTGTMKKD